MAITGLAANEPGWYVSQYDPDKRDTLLESQQAGATVFYSRPIPNAIMTRIADQISTAQMSYGDMQLQTFMNRVGYRNREAFRFAVTGWDNFYFEKIENGQPVRFPIEYKTEVHMEGGKTYTVISESVLDQIFRSTIEEVGQEMWKRNDMTEDQRKKFEASLLLFENSLTSNAGTATTPTSSNEDASETQSGEDQPETDQGDQIPEGAAILADPRAAPVTGKTQRQKDGKRGARGGSA